MYAAQRPAGSVDAMAMSLPTNRTDLWRISGVESSLASAVSASGTQMPHLHSPDSSSDANWTRFRGWRACGAPLVAAAAARLGSGGGSSSAPPRAWATAAWSRARSPVMPCEYLSNPAAVNTTAPRSAGPRRSIAAFATARAVCIGRPPGVERSRTMTTRRPSGGSWLVWTSGATRAAVVLATGVSPGSVTPRTPPAGAACRRRVLEVRRREARDRMAVLVEHCDGELHDLDATAKTRDVLVRRRGYRRGQQDESDDSAHVVRMIYVVENALQARRAGATRLHRQPVGTECALGDWAEWKPTRSAMRSILSRTPWRNGSGRLGCRAHCSKGS